MRFACHLFSFRAIHDNNVGVIRDGAVQKVLDRIRTIDHLELTAFVKGVADVAFDVDLPKLKAHSFDLAVSKQPTLF